MFWERNHELQVCQSWVKIQLKWHLTIDSKTLQQLFDAIMILGYRSRNGSNRKRGSKNSTKRVNQEIFRF